MKLTHLDHGPVLHVVAHAHDIEDIYRLDGHRNPFVVTNQVMACHGFGWLAWHEGEPVAAFGGAQIHGGVWQMFLLATPLFPKVALGLTRFAKREVVPRLFDDLGAHRLQCDLHEKHTFVHRWVEGFGARREGVMEGYAADGASYFRYALVRPKTSTNPTNPANLEPAAAPRGSPSRL